jgi:hypothetical protein
MLIIDMKKKRGKKINIKLSNRWLYTFIVLGILAIIGIGVYAATYSPSGAGHPYTEISTCSNGQILKVVNGEWSCEDAIIPGLVGWCRQTSYGGCNAISPAYCDTTYKTQKCECSSGYIKEFINNYSYYTYYTCFKN